MENKINSIVKKFRSDRIRRQRFTALMTVLSMVVSSSVFWQLRSTGNALTDEYLCGMTEHVHSAECYSEALICTEDHEHTDECTAIVMNCDETVHNHSMQCMSDISADIESSEDWEATLPETLTDNLSENLIAVAASQLGYCESVRNFVLDGDSVRRGYTRYGQWYGSNYGEWNTMFTYFCLYYAGITEKIMPYGSGCWAWTETLSEAGLLTDPDSGEIKVGDLVFFDTNADDRPDRSGIVSAISKPDDEEEDSLPTITVIEGDLDDKVDEAEYSIEDEKLVGFVSIDKLAESYMEFLTSSPEDEELSESDMELPMLSFGDPEYAAYADNSNPDMQIKITSPTNEFNTSSEGNPYVVTSGTPITVEIILDEASPRGGAGYTVLTEEEYNNKSFGGAEWQYYDVKGTKIFTGANSWFSKDAGEQAGYREFSFDSATNELKCTQTFTLELAEGENERSVTYTFHDSDGNKNLYIKVVPDTSTPVSQPPTIKIIKPIRLDIHEYHKADNAFSVQPGDSVTLVGTVGKDKYTVYPNANEFNNAKAANADPDLQFVRVGNKYISTYARFWGLNDFDNNPQPGTLFNKTGNTVYDFEGENLTVTVTYTANEVGILGDNSKKYVVTFADDKSTTSIDQFWLTNDATILYVYSTVGWRDIDRVNEAMDGVGGDSGNGKYWKNAEKNQYDEGKYYIVHPGDEIFLAGEGNGRFENLQPWTGGTTNIIMDENVSPGDPSPNKTYVKLTMPNSVNGLSYYYTIDYVVSGTSRTFYFKLSEGSTWYKEYDHADIEIADGGIYKMVANHSVMPNGTVIETVRTYGASITKVFECDISLTDNRTYNIPGTDYSSQNSPGDTQYELTSKYKVDANGERIELPPGSFPKWQVNDRPTFNQADVIDADFFVNVHLIPESEITTITYPDGSTEEIINADFNESEAINVADVKLHMTHQSVIDAVNKCPDHSGLDFTIRDEEITSKLRSGNALIEAYKRLETDTHTDLNDDLVGGEFEFELYKCDSDFNINGKTPVSTVTNSANGYVYFDQQFYIYPGTGDLDHTDYYVIKEKIPNSPDEDITYSDRIVNVTVKYTATGGTDSPTYDTTVTYDGGSSIPEFVNTKKTNAYMLPNTGGSGTTMFFILGPMLMLGSALIAIRRKRKESV